MKIYVSVDMEGIAGIVVREQLRRGEYLYEEGRRLLTAEVNTLVETLLQVGATEIIVKDAHGTGCNLLVEQLHGGARYVLGAARTEQRFPGLDSSFAGAFLIGYHAMAGTLHAVRDHSYVPVEWQSLSINGVEVGEIALDALLIGLYGVPVLLVSGDDKTCAEARYFLGNIATYQTKESYGKHVALITSPKKVFLDLRQVVQSALVDRAQRELYTLAGPYELCMRYAGTEYVDARYFDGVTAVRVDGTTVLYRGDDLLALLSLAL